MVFLWSDALAFLVVIPLAVLFYVWIQRRRARFALRYSSLLVISDVVEKQRWRRHMPPVVFLLAVTAMLVALARPSITLPYNEAERTVILTIDVSASMLRGDTHPNRLRAAEAAATEFVNQQDPTVRIGVVAFSESASLVQLPTTNHDQVIAAIEGLDVDSNTAIGGAILLSLNTILQESGVAPVGPDPVGGAASANPRSAQPPGVIVLLTDGQNNQGPSPTDIAQEAASFGVRVYAVGIGTVHDLPAGVNTSDELDENTLKQIADTTHAQYFRAMNANALSEIYRNMHVQFNVREQRTEITPGFTALAVVLALLATTLSSHLFSGLP